MEKQAWAELCQAQLKGGQDINKLEQIQLKRKINVIKDCSDFWLEKPGSFFLTRKLENCNYKQAVIIELKYQ